MVLVASSVACLDLAGAEVSQVLAKGLANKGGTVYSRPFGGSIRGSKQFRIQNHLDGFHTVEDTPQSSHQSTQLELRGGVLSLAHGAPDNSAGWRMRSPSKRRKSRTLMVSNSPTP